MKKGIEEPGIELCLEKSGKGNSVTQKLGGSTTLKGMCREHGRGGICGSIGSSANQGLLEAFFLMQYFLLYILHLLFL